MSIGIGSTWDDDYISEQTNNIRSVYEIRQQIEFYEKEEKRYAELMKKFPNDVEYHREMFGYASRIYALKWVLLHR